MKLLIMRIKSTSYVLLNLRQWGEYTVTRVKETQQNSTDNTDSK